MEAGRAAAFETEANGAGAPASVPSGAVVAALWVCGALLLAAVLTVGFFGYTNPAMLIEFASLRLCG